MCLIFMLSLFDGVLLICIQYKVFFMKCMMDIPHACILLHRAYRMSKNPVELTAGRHTRLLARKIEENLLDLVYEPREVCFLHAGDVGYFRLAISML